MHVLYNDEIKNRLKRVEGQIRGVLRMMEEDKHCKDVVSQMSAVRSAVDKAIAHVVALNLEQCVIEAQSDGKDTKNLVKEAVELLVKSK
ncbi:metal-sensitive transcriptional regulator [Ferviditalea candida]|uniref:Metal-sensitive transcriptional regulator n=1 Tax=Ferviditalea candida TaxID=3108399 RepID=A0ABU5ZGF2_9BACL|nr:metal-sensitive transcriptional regulator [Paenibacillaceae bacterium T2]